jgi:hypothetical protein
MYKSSTASSSQSREGGPASAADCSVQVAVRVRPLLEMEAASLCSSCIMVLPQSQQVR